MSKTQPSSDNSSIDYKHPSDESLKVVRERGIDVIRLWYSNARGGWQVMVRSNPTDTSELSASYGTFTTVGRARQSALALDCIDGGTTVEVSERS